MPTSISKESIAMANQKYETFITVAEQGSFKSAAALLKYTQAGVSYLINSLEDELGVQLFIRNRSGVVLTADGKELLPFFKDVYFAEHRLQNRVFELKDLSCGTVRLSTFTSFFINLLPDLLKSFSQEYPNLQIDISCCDDMEELKRLVRCGEVDCGLCVLPTDPTFYTLPLFSDPLYAIMAKEHPLADKPFFPVTALGEFPYIALDNGPFNEMDNVFALHGVVPNILTSTNNDYSTMALVNANFGFSIYPELLLKNVLFPLVCKELETPAFREVAIVAASERSSSAAAMTFMHYTKKWIDENYRTPRKDATVPDANHK